MVVAFIGCGNMGEAILAGIHKKHRCCVAELDAKRQEILKDKYRVYFGMIADIVEVADVVILAVKPQDMGDVLAEIKGQSLKGKIIVSIAAGITTKSLEKKLGIDAHVVRVMPNLPAKVGEGMTGLCKGKKATGKDLKLIQEIFETVGQTMAMDEKGIDSLTAVSGSGPAYVFLFLEVFANAAKKLGFTEVEAEVLAYQTLVGSVEMLKISQDNPGILRAKVTSKGGTTHAAVEVLTKGGIQKLFDGALKAAKKRAKELSK